MNRKILILSIFLLFSFCIAQEKQKAVYIKGNALFLPVLMFNAGVEVQLSDKYTLQADGFISPWKSFFGNHAQVYMGHIEGRYYLKEAFYKWYVGINTGLSLFDLTKWNYFGTDKFQRGYNYMFGAVIGYQINWKERWNIDIYLGGGTSQSYYHGYEKIPSDSWIRYEETSGWNKSGEWLPYRGGIMISYKL